MMKHLSKVLPALAAALLLAATPAHADFPDKPIRIVVPFVAGGTIDLIARQIGQRLSTRVKQAVIVDNRGGAGGSIGTDAVVKAEPDGYTILLHSGGVVTEAVLKKNPMHDVRRDLTPITLAASGPFALIVNPKLPVNSTAELLRYAKDHPGKLNYSSSGVGSQVHLITELFASMAGIKLTHIPYKGGSQSVAAIVSNDVQMAFVSLPVARPFTQQGRMRAIGNSSQKRSELWPELQPVGDVVPGFDGTVWIVMFAPARTPAAIVNFLNRELVAILGQADMRAWMRDNGLDGVGDTPDEFRKKIHGEIERWAELKKSVTLNVE